MYKFFKATTSFLVVASAAISFNASAQAFTPTSPLQPSLPVYQPGAAAQPQGLAAYQNSVISSFAANGSNAAPNGGSAYPYLPTQNLAAASQILVDPADSRTDTVTYSPYLGRTHGNLYYQAPTNRQLVDDRPYVVTTSAAFQGKFANRRAGARQLDAQNRRSGYRILGTSAQQQAVVQQPSERKIRIVRYPVPVRVGVSINKQQAQQRFVQQLQVQQVPTQNLYIQSQARALQVAPQYSQYYTSQAAPVQYGQVQYGAPTYQQGIVQGGLVQSGYTQGQVIQGQAIQAGATGYGQLQPVGQVVRQ